MKRILPAVAIAFSLVPAAAAEAGPLRESFSVLRRDAGPADRLPKGLPQGGTVRRVGPGWFRLWWTLGQGTRCTFFTSERGFGGGCGGGSPWPVLRGRSMGWVSTGDGLVLYGLAPDGFHRYRIGERRVRVRRNAFAVAVEELPPAISFTTAAGKRRTIALPGPGR